MPNTPAAHPPTPDPRPPGSDSSTSDPHPPGPHSRTHETRTPGSAAPAPRSAETRSPDPETRTSGTEARTSGTGAHTPEAGGHTPGAGSHTPGAGTPTGATTSGTGPSRRSRPVILAAALAAVGAAAVLVGWGLPLLTEDVESEPTPAAGSTAPPTAPTTSPHDDSVFERDVTYPDGSVVQAKSSFDKTWRIRNAGNVPWQDRYLTRMNDTPCKAPKRVGIGPVLPGESVDITVRVRAPESPGRCKIFWKMTDEDGTPLLSAKKPIFLDVTVA